MRNGLKIQWGKVVDTSGSNWNAVDTYFPIVFNTSPIVTAIELADRGDDNIEFNLIYNSITSTKFTIWRKTYPVYRGHTYIAIGY